VFGELLRVRFTFSVPSLRVESLTGMIASLKVEGNPLRHALLAGAKFAAPAGEVSGCLMVVFGLTSLEWFVREAEAWGDRAAGGG
jgi:hypothetical protein